jgi:hypothetical protein
LLPGFGHGAPRAIITAWLDTALVFFYELLLWLVQPARASLSRWHGPARM